MPTTLLRHWHYLRTYACRCFIFTYFYQTPGTNAKFCRNCYPCQLIRMTTLSDNGVPTGNPWILFKTSLENLLALLDLFKINMINFLLFKIFVSIGTIEKVVTLALHETCYKWGRCTAKASRESSYGASELLIINYWLILLPIVVTCAA